jgi:nitric oxide dioxygenase
MNPDDVELPEAALFYLCGPLPFMAAIRSTLQARGVPAHDIQYEVSDRTCGRRIKTEPIHG